MGVVEQGVVGAVEDAFLEEEDGVVEVVDFALLDPEQLVTLGDGVHEHLLGLHEVLEHERVGGRGWCRVRGVRGKEVGVRWVARVGRVGVNI